MEQETGSNEVHALNVTASLVFLANVQKYPVEGFAATTFFSKVVYIRESSEQVSTDLALIINLHIMRVQCFVFSFCTLVRKLLVCFVLDQYYPLE